MLFCCWFFVLVIVGIDAQMSSPKSNYSHSVVLQVNVSNLWWTVNETSQEIIFELHVKTTGWIALGISPGKQRNRFFLLNVSILQLEEWLVQISQLDGLIQREKSFYK